MEEQKIRIEAKKKDAKMDKGVEKAVKRLERLYYGRNVRVVKKDYEAVTTVAEHIINMIPSRYHDYILPRGYYIVTADYDLGKHKFLCKNHFDLDYRRLEFVRKRQYLNARPMPVTVIEFAQDLHMGFLREIVEWINEKRKEEVQK